MPGRNPADLWSDLAEEAGVEEADRAAAVSVAQAERELADAGVDVASERAKAAARLAALERPAAGGDAGRDRAARKDGQKAPPESDIADPAAWVTRADPAPQRSRPARWAMLLAAALAAAATGGVLYALGHRSKPVERPVDVPSQEPAPPGPAPVSPSAEPEVPPPPSPGPEKPSPPRRHGAP